MSVDETLVIQWLWGFLAHLRRRGAVWHPELSAYAKDGNVWALRRSQGRGEWMPVFVERSPRPVFLTLGRHRDFDSLVSNSQTWFTRWERATLGQQTLLPENVTDGSVHARHQGARVA